MNRMLRTRIATGRGSRWASESDSEIDDLDSTSAPTKAKKKKK